MENLNGVFVISPFFYLLLLRYYSTAKGNRIHSVHMFIFDALENLGVYQPKFVLLQENDVQ